MSILRDEFRCHLQPEIPLLLKPCERLLNRDSRPGAGRCKRAVHGPGADATAFTGTAFAALFA